MKNPTKFCQLSLSLTNGVRVSGQYHVEAKTSSTIRPSDAIRENKGGFLLLSDVTIDEPIGRRTHPVVMIPYASIAHIELPPTRWMSPNPVVTDRPAEAKIV